jgi:hypothetical protein
MNLANATNLDRKFGVTVKMLRKSGQSAGCTVIPAKRKVGFRPLISPCYSAVR